MSKNFCRPIILIITLLFISSCGQQEHAEMEHRVGEKLETESEDTSGMDEHADHTSMVAASDERKKQFAIGHVLCTPRSKCQNRAVVPFVRWI